MIAIGVVDILLWFSRDNSDDKRENFKMLQL